MIAQRTRVRAAAKKVGAGLWLIIFGLTLAWRAQNLAAFGLSNDEGAHLMWARLAVDGYPLYSQTQAVQAPLFLETVGLAFRLLGQTIQAGRWAMLMGFGLLAVSLSWLAYRAGGWLAAGLAMGLLGISPLIFTFSRLVMAEVPATGLAVAALALFFLFFERGVEHATENENVIASGAKQSPHRNWGLLRSLGSLAVTCQAILKGGRGWLLASGLVLGLSLITKALNPFVAVPMALLLLLRHSQPDPAAGPVIQLKGWSWPVLLLDSLLWSLGLLFPLAATLLLYGPTAIYDQLVVFRGDLRAAIPGSPAETWAQFAAFFNSHWGFWLLAFGSIMATIFCARAHQKIAAAQRQDERESRPLGLILHPSSSPALTRAVLHPLIWAVWLMAGLAMLWWHTPLFPHHFIVLLPPLILLGADAVVKLSALGFASVATPEPGQAWTDRATTLATIQPGSHSIIRRYGAVIALALLVGGAAFNLPAMVKANQATAAIVTGGRETEALALLQAVSAPEDFIMGDSQLLIFMAGRRTPPPLGDVALVAIKAGRQTSARMINLTETYQAPAVVQWSLRLPWLPEYLDWVEANYLAHRVWDNDHIIYFGPRFPAGQVAPHERAVRLGDSLTLRGYQLDQAGLAPDQELRLKVYWQTDAPLAHDYTIFTQLLNQEGTLVAGWDSQPLGGYWPTRQWPSHELVTDIVRLPLPVTLPAGEYTLITGMYRLETLERLQTPEGNDYITLTTLKELRIKN